MPNGRSNGRRRGRRPKRRSDEKGGRTVQTAAPALFAFMGPASSSVGLSAWRWAFASPHFGSKCFRSGQRKAIIRTHHRLEIGSDYIGLVPVVGVEPTRVISTRDFESPSSAIPTHRLIVYVIITYLAVKIKRKVSLGPNSPAQRAAAAQTGAAGGDSAFWGAARAGALAAALMGSFLAGAGHLFSKKTLQMTRNFILYK